MREKSHNIFDRESNKNRKWIQRIVRIYKVSKDNYSRSKEKQRLFKWSLLVCEFENEHFS